MLLKAVKWPAALATATAALAQMPTAGPALLTRGEAPAAMATPGVSFRPFLSVTGLYDTGLTAVAVNPDGQLGSRASAGAEFSGGISGVHSWRRTKLGLDYKGSIRHYNRTTYYDGANQSLMLGLTHQLSRHASLAVRQSAGLFSRSFGLLGLPQTIPFDPSSSYIPTSDFYDNRTVYLSTQADLTVQKSLRLSYNLGGDGFLARRRSSALYGVGGGGARADVQYRLNRRSTIGAGYMYTHYAFHGVFSGTDIHAAVASYGIRLTSTVEFSGYGGFLRAETKFLQSVPIDPAIAALIGRSAGSLIVHRIDYMPNVSGRLSKTFERGVAYISGGHSITPGNGLFLTSRATTVNAGYTYTGLRRWSFNIQTGYNSSESLGNVLGDYGSVNGGLSVSRQLGAGLHAIANFTARQYQSRDFDLYNRLIYNARLGIGFTPGAIPLRLW